MRGNEEMIHLDDPAIIIIFLRLRTRRGIQLNCRKLCCRNATASSRTRNRTAPQFTIRLAKWCPSTAITCPNLGPVPCLSTARSRQRRTCRRPLASGVGPELDPLTAAIAGPMLSVRLTITFRRTVPMIRTLLRTRASMSLS